MTKIKLTSANKISIVFYIFIIISVVFLFAGVYSAYTFATIVDQKNSLLTVNPQNVEFNYKLCDNGYFLMLNLTIKNTGPYEFWINKISWLSFLVNGTHQYQANDYSFYNSSGILIKSGEMRTIAIVDNTSVKQWMGYVYPHIIWEKKILGSTNWHIEISFEGRIDNYHSEEYQYNVKTWYLWLLPEVDKKYEESITLS